MRPLNGEKTHPLSSAALIALGRLTGGPMLRSAFNPGVSNRLERESLVETVDLPSDLRAHRGRKVPHLRITAAGRTALGKEVKS